MIHTLGEFPHRGRHAHIPSLPIDLSADASLPSFSKSFAPSSFSLGGRRTLTFTIDDSANASGVLNFDFTDKLPGGMEIADPANATTTCETAVIPPTLTAAAGTNVIILDANGTFAMPSVDAGASCTVAEGATVTRTFLVALDFPWPASIINTARVRLDNPDPNMGNNDSTVETAIDDVPIEIVALSLTSVDPFTVTTRLGLSSSLGAGLYRLLVCDTITDAAGKLSTATAT